MTDEQARKWATRFIDTWPNGPRAYVWREILTDLDDTLVATTYRRLQREVIRGAPTPGQFHETYTAERRTQPEQLTYDIAGRQATVAEIPDIIRTSYLEQCRQQGRDPDYDYLSRVIERWTSHAN